MSFGPDQTPQFSLLLCIKKGIILTKLRGSWYFVDALSMNINKKKSLLQLKKDA